MTLESKLLKAVQEGSLQKVEALLERGADLRHDNDAALRVAILRGELEMREPMRELLLSRYPDEVSREAAVERINWDLTQRIHYLSGSHMRLVHERYAQEKSEPTSNC